MAKRLFKKIAFQTAFLVSCWPLCCGIPALPFLRSAFNPFWLPACMLCPYILRACWVLRSLLAGWWPARFALKSFWACWFHWAFGLVACTPCPYMLLGLLGCSCLLVDCPRRLPSQPFGALGFFMPCGRLPTPLARTSCWARWWLIGRVGRTPPQSPTTSSCDRAASPLQSNIQFAKWYLKRRYVEG